MSSLIGKPPKGADVSPGAEPKTGRGADKVGRSNAGKAVSVKTTETKSKGVRRSIGTDRKTKMAALKLNSVQSLPRVPKSPTGELSRKALTARKSEIPPKSGNDTKQTLEVSADWSLGDEEIKTKRVLSLRTSSDSGKSSSKTDQFEEKVEALVGRQEGLERQWGREIGLNLKPGTDSESSHQPGLVSVAEIKALKGIAESLDTLPDDRVVKIKKGKSGAEFKLRGKYSFFAERKFGRMSTKDKENDIKVQVDNFSKRLASAAEQVFDAIAPSEETDGGKFGDARTELREPILSIPAKLYSEGEKNGRLTVGLLKEMIQEADVVVASMVDKYLTDWGLDQWAAQEAPKFLKKLGVANGDSNEGLAGRLLKYKPEEQKGLISALVGACKKSKDIDQLKKLRNFVDAYESNDPAKLAILRRLNDELEPVKTLQAEGLSVAADYLAHFEEIEDISDESLGEVAKSSKKLKEIALRLAVLPDAGIARTVYALSENEVQGEFVQKLNRLTKLKTICEENIPAGEARAKTLAQIEARIIQVEEQRRKENELVFGKT